MAVDIIFDIDGTLMDVEHRVHFLQQEPKDWETCNCFALYTIMASPSEIETMKTNYENGGYGYGHAKQALFELIVEKFKAPRERYNYYMNNLAEIDKALAIGAEKATEVANDVLQRVRIKVGY